MGSTDLFTITSFAHSANRHRHHRHNHCGHLCFGIARCRKHFLCVSNLNCCWPVLPQPAYHSLLQCRSSNWSMLGRLPSALETSALHLRLCGDLWTTRASQRSSKTLWKGIGFRHRSNFRFYSVNRTVRVSMRRLVNVGWCRGGQVYPCTKQHTCS